MTTVVIADDSPTLRRIVSDRAATRGLRGRAGRGRRRGRAGGVPHPARRGRPRRPDAAGLGLRRRPPAQGRLADRGHPGAAAHLARRGQRPLLGRARRRRPVPHQGLRGAAAGRGRAATCIKAAEAARGGRPRLRAGPGRARATTTSWRRVCDLLDRKLFEASVAAEVTTIAADVHGFEETVAAVLGVLGRIVDCDLVGCCCWSSPAPRRRRTCRWPVDVAQRSTASSSRPSPRPPTQSTGAPTPVLDLNPRVADPDGELGASTGRRGPGDRSGDVPVDAAARRRTPARAARAVQRHRERLRRDGADHPASW